jgi:hypothetical protein
MRQTILEIGLAAIAFFLVDRIIRFFGSMTDKRFKDEHYRIQVELSILGILVGFILLHLFKKGIKLPKWA